MQCPRCGWENFVVVKVERTIKGDLIRYKECKNCHKLVKTREDVIEVSVYRKNVMKSDYIPLDKYDYENDYVK